MSIKYILSDLDGVIRKFPETRDLAIEMTHGLPKGTLFGTAFKNPILEDAVCGRITDEEWRSDIESKIGQKFKNCDAQRVVSEWSQFSGDVDHSYLECLKLLFPNTPVAILTNGTTRLHSDLEKLNLALHFFKIFNSAEIGFCKPDKKVYLHVLDVLKCNAGEILFIDDSIKHIKAAQELGFRTHHFQSVEHFKSKIESLKSDS